MKIIYDITLKNITLADNNIQDKNLYIGFVDNDGLPTTFDNLSFGFSVKENDVVIQQKSFPQNGIIYESTDQEFLIGELLDSVRLGKQYVLSAWATNGGTTWSEDFDVLLPRWTQPFPSWIWNEDNECWIAPVPLPEDISHNYSWNEELQTWDIDK